MIALRDAGPDDRAAVLALFAALQEVERAMEPNRLPGAACGPHVDHLLDWAGRTGFALLAEADGAAVGLLIAGTADEGAYVLPENRVHGVVSDLYVAPAVRRRGVARALLAEAERRFRAAGLARMEIGALVANAPARALYEAWAGAPYAQLYARDLRGKQAPARDAKAVALRPRSRHSPLLRNEPLPQRNRQHWGGGVGMVTQQRQGAAIAAQRTDAVAAGPLLEVSGLTIRFGVGALASEVVSDVGFAVRRGETLSLVGESGSGKTLTGKALLRILPRGAHMTAGKALFRGRDGEARDLLSLRGSDLRAVRGGRISMIFQEPMSSLSPLHTVGDQTAEAVRLHTDLSGHAVRERCLEIFDQVGFPAPARAWDAYPFELSGGLRQRAMIAMAMVCKPDLLIADEPTTALDVTTQAQVLDLIKQLQAEMGLSVILITHDLGVVANMADRVIVMRRGRVVEAGSCDAILTRPGHGYTRALIAAAPEIPEEAAGRDVHGEPVFWARSLSKTYLGRRSGFTGAPQPINAVRDVDLTVGRRETFAIVGESGSGKSTIAKLMLRAEEPDPGAQVGFRGADGRTLDVMALSGGALKAFRGKVQIVFQDPYASLSPRMAVMDILTEPLRIHGRGDNRSRREWAAELMRRVGLSPDHLGRYPHAFSGGQRQRISIARALALEPELLVCDEPTSALDVSVQAQVLDLLKELRDEMGLSYLFISHDLTVVADLADRVAVMRQGRIVEQGPASLLFRDPRHPYTRALIAASPEPDMNRRLDLAAVAQGAGAPDTWPAPFAYKGDAAPGFVEVTPGHFVRCEA